MKGRHIFFAIVTIILPFVILMNGVILVFTENFLTYEYKTPDFPADPYGFTLEDRIEYGTKSVNYITNVLDKLPETYLADLTMKDGTPLYNEREVSHMADVKNVFQICRGVMAMMIVFIILTGWLVTRRPDSFPGFLRALAWGSSLTLVILILVGIGIYTGFDALFDGFHHLFFTGDSWLFYENDSLIRLFPEQLWVNGFALAALLSAMLAFGILLLSLIGLKKIRSSRKKKMIS